MLFAQSLVKTNAQVTSLVCGELGSNLSRELVSLKVEKLFLV
jgi:hypothetical protein